jgi:ABC-type nitrate/sulfonate/bicarbonate transport system permease component
MHATTHTDALDWRQRLMLGALLALLLGCAAAIGIGAYMAHQRGASGVTPIPAPMPVAPYVPGPTSELPPIVIPGDA